MNRRIVYVEDDEVDRENYARMLRGHGFTVESCASGAEALAVLRQGMPDLAILDVTHHYDRDAGYQICADLRRISSELPIIFLTSRQAEVDKISGFRLGADDYISKDVSENFILVRIEALFRRLDAVRRHPGHSEASGGKGRGKGIELNEEYSSVSFNGSPVDMPLTQYWIVRELFNNPGQVRSHRELMRAANIMVEANTIAAHIKAIRQCFCRLDPQFQGIKTERGRGYRWVL